MTTITTSHVEKALRYIAQSFGTVPTADRFGPLPRPQLSPNFRRVHAEPNGTEREPRDSEPFTIVERRGDWEYCTLPVFKSFHGIRFVKPHLNGPWDITELSDEALDDELPDGQRQGWAWWIRLAREARS